MNTLSLEERTDALIALSIVFDRQSSQSNGSTADRSFSNAVNDSLRALTSQRRETFNKRVVQVESLSEIQRQRWLGRWIDNIRRRRRSTKLDENIHAEQIAKVLGKEPLSIRRSILGYLPLDISRNVEVLLDRDQSARTATNEFSNDLSKEILDVVKLRFLANFVQIESISDANALDEMSVDQLGKFIRVLGLREIAVACRGIRSREKIAAFLCRFAEEDAKAIATYLSELDQVEAIWVSIADRTVQRLWNRRLRPHQILHKIGMELLACAFARRSEAATRYTSQKLSCSDERRWEKMIAAGAERLNDPDTRMVEIERKRAAMIVRMARTFKLHGSL